MNDWLEGGAQSVNPNLGVRELLCWLRETPGIFKILMNFTLPKFEELCSIVCPYIAQNARSTNTPQVQHGQ